MKNLSRFLAIFSAVAFLSVAAAAQPPAVAPPAPVTPPQVNTPQDPPLDLKLPTLFIVGDSTARNGADLGWGDHLAHYFDTTKINVADRSRAGRSSRSYMVEGLWDKRPRRDEARRLCDFAVGA